MTDGHGGGSIVASIVANQTLHPISNITHSAKGPTITAVVFASTGNFHEGLGCEDAMQSDEGDLGRKEDRLVGPPVGFETTRCSKQSHHLALTIVRLVSSDYGMSRKRGCRCCYCRAEK